MSNAFLGAFAAIALLAAGGVDYVSQARQAGLAPGSLTATGYGATIADRIAGREPQRAAAAAETAQAGAAPAKSSGAKSSGAKSSGAKSSAAKSSAAKSSGGILAMITGLFGGQLRSGDARAAAVTRIGANGGCALNGGVKRCSVGGN